MKFRRAIVWFRRDLRVSDNRALHAACSDAAEVIPAYIVSPWSGAHLWTGPNRQSFLSGCLRSLEQNIAALGGHLIFRRGSAPQELEALIDQTKADALFYSFDPDPFGKETESQIRALCSRSGVAFLGHLDCALHRSNDILTGTGTPYRVFTPFSKNWFALDKPSPLPKPKRIPTPSGIPSLACPSNSTWNLPEPSAKISEPGERAAHIRLEYFIANAISAYRTRRDRPSASATSRLSQDLRFGTLSPRQIFARCQSAAASPDAQTGIRTFLTEIAWREFYFSILHHFPEVLQLEFNPEFRNLPWSYDESLFDAWKNGQTGFPLVDAGIRQLAATGFMHNRVRMVVSMFLTKDLHLDWRLGEQFFMQSLTDGEIASNNGGWQWSAGTGADAAPYFRIQNPWSQTKSHDPDGTYIKTWVPELRSLNPILFLAPPENGKPLTKNYPLPLVDHKIERGRTLEMFKSWRTPR